ncbi:Uncharacterised protein [Klebsiella pneumoniae]|nr:Uncharacterised protein [Klebsiella pneumoniae]VGL51735.1 Uncharacterised protein [Klebsiella quasipneumoniae]VGB04351.1 Uncharacterised protein [Klebsiella pneumoniae]VGC06072.1 Uncharacterised protein [Klebsiella pneumoniae]VGD50015.1 Uncharacterised protein [Klebsiella pneumoniae]
MLLTCQFNQLLLESLQLPIQFSLPALSLGNKMNQIILSCVLCGAQLQKRLTLVFNIFLR